MRVCCFHYDLHPDTAAALPPGAELVPTPDDYDYWRELARRWDGSDDLVVIEHDIVIHDQVIPQFAACGSPWCTFPYFYGPDHDPSRVVYETPGCAKFSADCQRRFPLPPVSAPWPQVDGILCNLLRVENGLSACQHRPWVTHHGSY